MNPADPSALTGEEATNTARMAVALLVLLLVVFGARASRSLGRVWSRVLASLAWWRR